MLQSLINKFKREPDFIVGGKDDPYLLRWWIIPRNRFFNIYLHKFLRSDDDRALHDHMYVRCSIILKGAYIEHFSNKKRKYRKAGYIVFRKPTTAHRVQLLSEWTQFLFGKPITKIYKPCWTLFITGPRVREWGFHCPNGWRHWEEFTAPGDKGSIGKGCD